ncbi:hypothetical protein VQ056_22195 [Paenibacillus sp. JTLBN-2024]
MNEEEAKLKTTLLHLRAGRKGSGDDLHPEQLLPDMLKHIGSTDPELRDDLIYSTICRWTKQRNISPAAMRRLLVSAMDKDHLFQDRGKGDGFGIYPVFFGAYSPRSGVYA